VWNHEWLELQSALALDLPGDPGLMAVSEVAYYDEPTNEQPYYYQVYTMLGNVTGFTGDCVVTELTFHVLQDPNYEMGIDFYSLFYIAYVDAATDCGERIDPISKQHAMVKLHSVPTVITKEVDKEIVWKLDEEITMDLNIYNATKLKSFEFLLNMPPWLYVDLQEDPIQLGDFLPGPYEELIIVVGPSINWPWVCEDQIWIKVIRDCTKDPVSGDGTLATITFKVDNPFLEAQEGPEYCYNETWHLWLPENRTGEICFKEEQSCQYPFYEDMVWIDGYYGWQDPTPQEGYAICYDLFQEKWAVLLGPPFGPEMTHPFFWTTIEVAKKTITFCPIPGDGNLDGHVGLLDLLFGLPFSGIAKVAPHVYYDSFGPIDTAAHADALGLTVAEWERRHMLCDINGDDVVDLLDLVQMAKNWCRDTPIECRCVPM
jgi:hypothetical protein